MANILIAQDGLTGAEGTDTVQGVNSASLADETITLAFESNQSYIYRYDSSSTAAHSSPGVIQPCDTPASGRHILQSAYEGLIDHDALTNFLDAEHKTSTVIRAETGTPLYLETRTDDPSSPADGRIWLRTDL